MSEQGRNGEFYAKGNVVRKSPIFQRNEANDGDNVTIGFPVCTASEWIDAETLAGVFNEHASLQSLKDEIAAKDERIARLEEALERICLMHDGNPPMPLADIPEIDYARRTISNIHREARAALRDTGSERT